MRRLAELAGLVDLVATALGLVWWALGRLPAGVVELAYALQTAALLAVGVVLVVAVVGAVVALAPQRQPPREIGRRGSG